jgi:hypothetical protein
LTHDLLGPAQGPFASTTQSRRCKDCTGPRPARLGTPLVRVRGVQRVSKRRKPRGVERTSAVHDAAAPVDDQRGGHARLPERVGKLVVGIDELGVA